MLYYSRIDISKGNVSVKSNDNKECIIFTIAFLVMNLNFKIVCNGCHDLMRLCFKISDITIIPVKGIDYWCTLANLKQFTC